MLSGRTRFCNGFSHLFKSQLCSLRDLVQVVLSTIPQVQRDPLTLGNFCIFPLSVNNDLHGLAHFSHSLRFFFEILYSRSNFMILYLAVVFAVEIPH